MNILPKLVVASLIFILLIVVFPFVFSNYAFAILSEVVDPVAGVFSNYSLGGILSDLLPFIFGLAAMLALLFLLWGGIRYMLSRGDPKVLQSARGIIISAVIGLLIIIFVVAIFSLISSAFKIDILKIGTFGINKLIPEAYAHQVTEDNIFNPSPEFIECQSQPGHTVETITQGGVNLFLCRPVDTSDGSGVDTSNGVDIGCAVKLAGGHCIKDAFPTVGEFFTFVVRAILAIAAIVFLGMIVFGGFRYMSAGGNPDEAMAARASITGAIVGLLIVVVSFAIIELLIRTVGVGGSIFQ